MLPHEPTFAPSVPIFPCRPSLSSLSPTKPPATNPLQRVSPPKATATQPQQDSSNPPLSPPASLPTIPKSIPLPPHHPRLKNAVPYFAYFSNMNPNVLGPTSTRPMRRLPILRTALATLPAHRVVFDVPGIPAEPAFANLHKDTSSTVYGVLHWVSQKDFPTLAASEGIAYGTSSSVPPWLRLGEVRDVQVYIKSPQGHNVPLVAKTFFFLTDRVPSFLRPFMRPSRRYVKAAIDGAEFWGVNKEYVQNVLRKTQTARGMFPGFINTPSSRPHLLDRPNPEDSFGDPTSEIYSPFKAIHATKALRSFDQAQKESASTKIRLVHVSSIDPRRRHELRRLYFLPGIDGVGKSILSQMDGLDSDGEYYVSALAYPFANRQSLSGMVSSIIDVVLQDCNGKPVSFVSESMGGLLGIMLGIENCRRKAEGQRSLDIDLLMMINPASSYYRSNPKLLWDTLLRVGFSKDQYKALLPPILLPFLIDFDSAVHDAGPDTLNRLQKLLGALNRFAEILPQDAMLHRLELLSNASLRRDDFTALTSDNGPKKIALISSINDNLLPSLSEHMRLLRNIPGMYSMLLPYGGHAPMLDKRFSLASFLKPFKLINMAPTFNSSTLVDAKLQGRREALRKRVLRNMNGDISSEALAKSRVDVGRLSEWLSVWTERCSPVFVGEENIPMHLGGKPVLFVSNHTLLGWLDGMCPLLHLLKSRNILLRPLTHPQVFFNNVARFPGVPSASTAEMQEFGLVPVSPTALLEQLAMNQWTLLFPGGANEALKGGVYPKYSVIWPEEPEFVRPCALFGASVVPLATVGSEDMADVIVDAKTVGKAVDFVANRLGVADRLDGYRDNAKEWKGQNGEKAALMAPPLTIPSGEDRVYFKFGKPIDVPAECVNDSRLEKEVYNKVKAELEEGIEVLLRRREADSFRSIEKRRAFREKYGSEVSPPASPAWMWSKGPGGYLDEELQPPL